MSSAPQPWTVTEVDWSDPRAVALRADMDTELSARYAERFATFDPALRERFDREFAVHPETIAVTVLVLDRDGRPRGHAALRPVGEALEVKRVYIEPDARGKGASRTVMSALERIARDRGVHRLVLQTGDRQPDAVALYERIGYTPIPAFPPYDGYDFSLCFEKTLDARVA